MKSYVTIQPCPQDQRGFTLIELVIAVSILTLIMGIAYRAVSQISMSKTMLDNERDAHLIANSVLLRLTRELQLIPANAKLLPLRSQLSSSSAISGAPIEGENDDLNSGEAGDSIVFMAQDGGQYIPDGKTHTGMVQIGYRVEKNPDATTTEEKQVFMLIRDETPDIQPRDKAYERTMTFPITDRLLGLDFKYFDSELDQWQQEWPRSKQGRPKLIQLTIKLLTLQGKTMYFSTFVPVDRD